VDSLVFIGSVVCLTVQSAVSSLASRTKLLDPNQLEQVESRLAVVQQRLTQIAEKKEVAEQTAKLNKVSELYDVVHKWEAVSDSLPHIVERLDALQQLHDQGTVQPLIVITKSLMWSYYA